MDQLSIKVQTYYINVNCITVALTQILKSGTKTGITISDFVKRNEALVPQMSDMNQ